MSDDSVEKRWITPASEAKLTALLGLTDHLQDWNLECADANRLVEFLDLYENGELSDDDRFALMALIVASFDDWLSAGSSDEAVSIRLRRNLLSGYDLHRSTIHYWSLLDESNPDNLFEITPFMREIWKTNEPGDLTL